MNSTNPAIAQLIVQSQNVLSRGWLPSLILGIMGVVGLGENLVIIGVVLRGRLIAKAHHYFCVLNLAIADTFAGVVMTAHGLRRYIYYATGGNEIGNAWSCMAEVAPTFIASWATLSNTLVVAIDRLFGVAKPVEYKVADPKKMRMLNYAAWTMAIASTATIFAGVGDWLVPICGNAFVFDSWVGLFSAAIQAILETSIGLAYVGLMAVTFIRQRKVTASSEVRKEMSSRVAKSATFILSVFVLFFVVPDCIYTALSSIDGGAIVPYYGPWYLCLQYVPCCLNLPIYVWKNEQFRQLLRSLGGRFGKNTVTIQSMPLPRTKNNAIGSTGAK